MSDSPNPPTQVNQQPPNLTEPGGNKAKWITGIVVAIATTLTPVGVNYKNTLEQNEELRTEQEAAKKLEEAAAETAYRNKVAAAINNLETAHGNKMVAMDKSYKAEIAQLRNEYKDALNAVHLKIQSLQDKATRDAEVRERLNKLSDTIARLNVKVAEISVQLRSDLERDALKAGRHAGVIHNVPD